MASTTCPRLQSLLAEIVPQGTHPKIIEILKQSATSNLHPTLAGRNWTCSDADLLRLFPALALASKLLTSPQAMHFWHAYLFGPRTYTVVEGVDLSIFYPLYSTDHPLPEVEAGKVHQALDHLADNVSFSMGVGMGTHGETMPTTQISRDEPGHRSEITINNESLQAMDWSKPHVLLHTWVTVAVTIAHKLAHALRVCMAGPELPEPCFQNTIGFSVANRHCKEMGHDFEKWVLGNKATMGFTFDGQDVLIMGEHPPILANEQHAVEWHSTFAAPRLSGRELLVHLVNESWVESIFMEDFWTQQVPFTNGLALRPEQVRTGSAYSEERVVFGRYKISRWY